MKTLPFNLVQFIHILRRLDVRISSAEVLDAIQALTEVDILNKCEVKAALQATLIKNARDRAVFAKAFDLFFMPPEEKQRKMAERKQQQLLRDEELRAAAQELTWTDKRWQVGADGTHEVQEIKLEFSNAQLETYTRLPEHAKRQIRKMLEQATGNSINSPEELIRRTIQGALNYWKYHLLKQEQEQGLVPRFDLHFTGDEELDLVLDGVARGFCGYDDPIHYQDMKNIPDKDLERAGMIVQKLSRTLATRISRRYRQSRKRRKVDMRRTIRRNMCYGGVLLDLKYVSARVQKPKLLLICDVSESMARYGSFVLQFIYGLSSVVDGIESFAFSEDFCRLSPLFAEQRGFEATMADFLNESAKLGRGTDLHQALAKLNAHYKNLLTSKTIVIIVSDTKTLAAEKALKELQALRRQVKEVIWLNTLPKGYWDSVKTVALFQKECLMFECYTLSHLEHIVRRKIFASL